MPRWQNKQRTIRRDIADWRAPRVASEGDPVARFAAMGRIYGEILGSRRAPGVLTLGSAWSFSRLLSGDATTIATDGMDPIWRLPHDLALPSPENPDGAMVLVGGGARLGALNAFLEGDHRPGDLSLRTSGSHDGQSVAGMIGTGSHGSTLGFGAFQNQIKGLHLVTGPGRSVWLEPYPILDPAIIAAISTEPPIRDAALFDGALVHLGGMGIVSAALLEAAPFFLIDVVKTMKRLTAADIAMLAKGDFRGFAASCGRDEMPYHLEIVLDPYAPFEGEGPEPRRGGRHEAMITFHFRVPDWDMPVRGMIVPASQRREFDRIYDGPLGRMIIRVGRRFAGDLFNLIPPQMLYPILSTDFRRYLGQMRLSWGRATGPYVPRTFGGIEVPLHNDSFAFARSDLETALRRMTGAFRARGGGHLVMTLRFVSQAAGAMAFTRFPETVVVNCDGVRTTRSQAAVRRILAALECDPAIPFSQHWGKMGEFTQGRLRREYGDPGDPRPSRARRWREARETLLDPAMRAAFASDGLREWGLA